MKVEISFPELTPPGRYSYCADALLKDDVWTIDNERLIDAAKAAKPEVMQPELVVLPTDVTFAQKLVYSYWGFLFAVVVYILWRTFFHYWRNRNAD